MPVYAHHRHTIERLRDHFAPDPNHLALIIIGSVARGDAHARSDVDCLLVVTDAEYARREADGRLAFSANHLADYPDGEANIGTIRRGYVHEVARRGPEPARFAFTDALIAWGRIPDLAELIAAIPRYPEHERHAKLVSFRSQLPVHLAYMQLADFSQNPYLLAETAVELVLFGGRLILAHNRMLYPGRKLFVRELERAPDRPPDLLDLATVLLQQPGMGSARAFCDTVEGYHAWPHAPEGAMARFQHDRDLHWLRGPAALADS